MPEGPHFRPSIIECQPQAPAKSVRNGPSPRATAISPIGSDGGGREGVKTDRPALVTEREKSVWIDLDEVGRFLCKCDTQSALGTSSRLQPTGESSIRNSVRVRKNDV